MARSRTFAVALAFILLTGGLLVAMQWQKRQSEPDVRPDFSSYPAGEARKAAFLAYFGPVVDATNRRWQDRRQRLQRLLSEPASEANERWLSALAEFFDIEAEPFEVEHSQRQLVEALLVHVDTVPRSLALAQAAKESAWGASRFAREGNNYFGQRCFRERCGMIPANRPPGTSFEVRRFQSPAHSVASYMINLNSHHQYAGFRDYRARQRRLGLPVNGLCAAGTISSYSERDQAYVEELKAIIRINGLEQPAECPNGDLQGEQA